MCSDIGRRLNMETVSKIKVKVWQKAEENIDFRYHIRCKKKNYRTDMKFLTKGNGNDEA